MPTTPKEERSLDDGKRGGDKSGDPEPTGGKRGGVKSGHPEPIDLEPGSVDLHRAGVEAVKLQDPEPTGGKRGGVKSGHPEPIDLEPGSVDLHRAGVEAVKLQDGEPTGGKRGGVKSGHPEPIDLEPGSVDLHRAGVEAVKLQDPEPTGGKRGGVKSGHPEPIDLEPGSVDLHRAGVEAVKLQDGEPTGGKRGGVKSGHPEPIDLEPGSVDLHRAGVEAVKLQDPEPTGGKRGGVKSGHPEPIDLEPGSVDLHRAGVEAVKLQDGEPTGGKRGGVKSGHPEPIDLEPGSVDLHRAGVEAVKLQDPMAPKERGDVKHDLEGAGVDPAKGDGGCSTESRINTPPPADENLDRRSQVTEPYLYIYHDSPHPLLLRWFPRFSRVVRKWPPPPVYRFVSDQGTSIGGAGGVPYRLLSRTEINSLKEELKQYTNMLKEGQKLCVDESLQMRIENQKLHRLAEEYANMLKGALDTEAATLNISREHAADLKMLVEEMKEALKASKAGKRLNLEKFNEYAKLPKSCTELGDSLSSFALFVATALITLGYIQFEEPSPFNPMETKTGSLLFDDFTLGLKVSCLSSVSMFDSIRSVISGEAGALHSKFMLQRIQENWNCQFVLAPGRDLSVKGECSDVWLNGLKLKYNFPLFDHLERKLEFKLKHNFGSFAGAVSLNANPMVALTAMFGLKQLSAGCLVDIDAVPRIVRRIAVGGSFNMFGISASMMLSKSFQPQHAGQQPPQPDTLHQLTTSVHHQRSESTAVCAQLIHSLEEHSTSIHVGVEHRFDEATFVKAKLTNECVFTGLLKQKIGEKSSVSLCSSIDLRALNAVPRFGLSLSIAP